MPTFRFIEIECLNPLELVTDETYLRVYTEDGLLNGSYFWGPEDMRKDDLYSLRGLDPIEFHDFLHIRLVDRDARYDDVIGTITWRAPVSGFGLGLDAYLPGELVQNVGYRIRYDLLEEPTRQPRNRIELLSLHCDNPQGSKDRVSLEVNDTLMWGPGWMRRGSDVTFPANTYRDFDTRAVVRLRETQGEDWSSSFSLVARDYTINRRLRHTFAVDAGIVGDASYLLWYRMRWLPASDG